MVEPSRPLEKQLGVLWQNPEPFGEVAEFRSRPWAGQLEEVSGNGLKGFTGIRWGELVGLETKYARRAAIRVDWQLYELDNGVLHRRPPKDDSHRTVELPSCLAGLVSTT